MNGSGPAGELTFPDVRARLHKVTGHVAKAEAEHHAVAELVAAAREPAPAETETPPPS